MPSIFKKAHLLLQKTIETLAQVDHIVENRIKPGIKLMLGQPPFFQPSSPPPADINNPNLKSPASEIFGDKPVKLPYIGMERIQNRAPARLHTSRPDVIQFSEFNKFYPPKKLEAFGFLPKRESGAGKKQILVEMNLEEECPVLSDAELDKMGIKQLDPMGWHAQKGPGKKEVEVTLDNGLKRKIVIASDGDLQGRKTDVP